MDLELNWLAYIDAHIIDIEHAAFKAALWIGLICQYAAYITMLFTLNGGFFVLFL
ncbi:hypothetical protein KSC_053850 [Ktedonobacter sp. SOSP1-52]|nr:hypothetical protein KSC_053850 [Ktedonobacter sp. SOSP1-52]